MTRRTPSKPWNGEMLAVPPFLGGFPVLSALRVPTSVGEQDHQWVVILGDPAGRHGEPQSLIVCRVVFDARGWHRFESDYDITDFGRATERMIERAQVPQQMAAVIQYIRYDAPKEPAE